MSKQSPRSHTRTALQLLSAQAEIETLKGTVASLRLHYIGACSLLGRISGSALSEEQNDLVGQALMDCATHASENMEAVRTHDGGWSLELRR